MKHIRVLIVVCCTVFVLAGCTHVDDGEVAVVDDSVQQEQVIEVRNAPVVAENIQVPELRDQEEVVDSRVQIFSIDGATGGSGQDVAVVRGQREVLGVPTVPAQGIEAALDHQDGGDVFLGDSSVRIFSLNQKPEASRGVSKEERYSDQIQESGIVVEMLGEKGAPLNSAIIYFAHNSFELDSEAIKMVDRLSESFKAVQGQGSINVEGHASVPANYSDETQRKIVNLKISMDRALAVSNALISRGVPADLIRVIGWGEARPPQDLHDKTLDAASRRVEVSG